MNKDVFEIEGLGPNRVLQGSIKVNGAKNAVLKAIVSAMLFDGSVKIENAPDLADVRWLLQIMESMGFDYEFLNSSINLKAKEHLSHKVPFELAGKLRSSVVLIGPTLARLGKVSIPYPGGDKIGLRPIDLFLEFLIKAGASAKEDERYIHLELSQELRGVKFFFRRQSVTATESAMMAAVLARGDTVLENCAMEPEIKHLADFLNKSGARIEGAGTSTIKIEGDGGKLLQCKEPYKIPPDRIEAGSFLAVASVLAKDLKIENCAPEEMSASLELFNFFGLNFELGDDYIRVKDNPPASKLNMYDFVTHEYPGFPTDMQAPTVLAMTQMNGQAKVFESIFEGRFAYVEPVKLMGADIDILDTRNLLIKGPRCLRGRTLRSVDIRAGLAYIIAASVAHGHSRIEDVFHIDRGYEKIEKRLAKIGIPIKRVKY